MKYFRTSLLVLVFALSLVAISVVTMSKAEALGGSTGCKNWMRVHDVEGSDMGYWVCSYQY